MASFNDIELQRIKKIIGAFCKERIPDHQRFMIKLFYEIRGFEVKITESRPSFPNSSIWVDTPIARLQYDPDTLCWQLYWMRGTGKWQLYEDLEPTNSLQDVINKVAEDPHYVFWG